MPDLIIFDGQCHLCAGSVQFILKHESAPHYLFAPVQSTTGAQSMLKHGLDPSDVNTFLVIEDDLAFTRSDAALRIARRLRLPWRLLVVLALVPRPLRNWGYNLVASNRYRWFGRSQECWLPNQAYAKRFID
jgi:predicted DCC family thiol-disulfide oxidoreductase YuxK